MVNKSLILMSCLSLLWGCSPPADEPEPTSDQSLRLPALSSRAKATSVQTLKQNQPDTGKTVFLEGEVRRRVPLLEGWLYELQDSTGSLWVLTQSSDPIVGNTARVEGVLQYEQILVEGIDMGEYYLQERTYQPITTSD